MDGAVLEVRVPAASSQLDVAQALFSRTPALVVIVDDEQRLAWLNPAAATAIGLGAEGADTFALTRQRPPAAETVVAPRHIPEFRRAVREAMRGVTSVQEFPLPCAGEQRPRSIAWSFSAISDEPSLTACVGVDVSATRDEFEHLRSQAVTDDLTGLPNRAGLLDHLATMAGSGATVVFCDLNGFKRVNDTLGHAAGDAVLVQTARRLRRTVRGEDFVARLGGDEFVIVVPPDADASFEGLARRLLRAIDQPMVLPGGVAATVGMSVGQAVLAPDVDPASALVAADQDMYKMKSRLPTRTTGDPD